MAVGTALLVGGGVLSAASQFRGGEEQEDAFRDLAEQILQAGQAQARDFERQSSARAAGARTARATSGVQINTGTSLMVDEEIVKEIAKGRERILEDARRRARAARKKGESSSFGGKIGAAGTLLSTAGSAFT